MKETHRIRRAEASDADALVDLLLDVVAAGASVGFMLPLSRARALEAWTQWLDGAVRGERIVLVAEDATTRAILGTVQLVTTMPDNQPHRGDIAKMQVHSSARRRGLGAALLLAAEAEARAAGKTLLVLDTVTGSDGYRLYTRLGWQRVGEIPNYALFPAGGFCSTTYFFRNLST
jgi:ribosomal protein S18 acetylase RimI-like enzyme